MTSPLANGYLRELLSGVDSASFLHTLWFLDHLTIRLKRILTTQADNHINVLSWLERLQIVLDAGQGLDYLHNGCKPPIIHRDIKSTKILLNEKMEANLADFGLSRAFSADDGAFVTTRVIGTPRYLDPGYHESQKLHEKSDIYSLGIVVLELITGSSAVFKGNQDQQQRHISQRVNLLVVTADIETIVDRKLNGDYDTNWAWKALEVAMACSSSSSSGRPAMARSQRVKTSVWLQKDHVEQARPHIQWMSFRWTK